jgi:hypothetical protein
MRKQIILLGAFLLVCNNSFAQQQINLATKLENKQITAVERVISQYSDHPEAVEMNARNSDGLGILADIEFTKGTIEIELLGENNPGKSFIGIAFNIQDDKTYEAIYLRPFNFVAEEQIRKEHMVQYIFHPEFTWRKLREERTGEFENEISSPPNPDKWFKVRIIIAAEKVEVYVNDIPEAVLTIDRLTSIKSKRIGLWTGYGSSGRYRNLVLSKK